MKNNTCLYCGVVIPEGRMICPTCNLALSGVKADCIHFQGSCYCLLKMDDCVSYPCKYYEKDQRKMIFKEVNL